jgi:hypothetical protein
MESFTIGQKLPALYGTCRLITEFIRGSIGLLFPILSQINLVYTLAILILSFHLCLGLPRGLLHSYIPTTSSHLFLISPTHAACSVLFIHLDFIIRLIIREEYKL